MARLVQVISTPTGIGGAEAVALALANAAIQRGWDSYLLNIFAASPEEELSDHVAGSYEACVATSQSNPVAVFKTRRWLARRLAELRADVVQASLLHAAVVVAGLPKDQRTFRILSHQHGDHLRASGRRLGEWVDRLAGKRYDRVVACSDAMARFLVEEYDYVEGKVVSIRNGWTGTPLLSNTQKDDPPTVVCTARFRPQKDHFTLLRAFARVVDELPVARLRLLGDGPELNKCMKMAEDLGISTQVDFTGQQSSVWPWLADADVFVLTSRYEPLGIAILEAMAAELPIVATAVGGITELVEEGQNGFLAPVGDENGVAVLLHRLLTDPQLAKRLGKHARQTADANRMEVTVERYFELYEQGRECP